MSALVVEVGLEVVVMVALCLTCNLPIGQHFGIAASISLKRQKSAETLYRT